MKKKKSAKSRPQAAVTPDKRDPATQRAIPSEQNVEQARAFCRENQQ